jgi:predicted nucleotidyltransferase
MTAPEFFSARDRDRVKERMLQLARSDDRVVAAAIIGSLALEEGDRWSDLDLTFAVAGDQPVLEVLDNWTRVLIAEFDAVQLFDLPSGVSIYRVFLLPGCLQFDLSFTPAAHFGAIGPKFKLLFGSAVEKPHIQPTPAQELFGYAVHHAVRARICIERGRYWQAEYWISGARDYALSLACHRRDLSPFHGRGFDDLPADVRDMFSDAFVHWHRPDALIKALRAVVTGLLSEAGDLEERVKLKSRLHELIQS